MKESWVGSQTERMLGDTVYEKEKYYTKDAKPYKVKKVYFTFMTEDEDGNEREFKEYEITTETKETVLMHLRQSGYVVEEHPNHIVLNPETDNEAVDIMYFTNHFLFNECNEQNMDFPLRVAMRITDELNRFREFKKEQDEYEGEE